MYLNNPTSEPSNTRRPIFTALILRYMLLTLFTCGFSGGVSAEDIQLSTDPNVHPVPGLLDAPQSSRYLVNAGGHEIEVKDEPYDFDVAMFTMGTTPVRINVVLASDFDSFTLKPDRHGIEVERIEKTRYFVRRL